MDNDATTQSALHHRASNELKSSSFRACQTCRQRKVKCVAIAGNDTTCEYCQAHGVVCQAVEPAAKRKRLNTATELKARVEQLEAKLSHSLMAQSDVSKRLDHDEQIHAGAQRSVFPYEVPGFRNLPDMGNAKRPHSLLHERSPLQSSRPDIFPVYTNARKDLSYDTMIDPYTAAPDPSSQERRSFPNHKHQGVVSEDRNLTHTLPLPNLSVQLQNPVTSNFVPTGPPNRFSPLSDRQSQYDFRSPIYQRSTYPTPDRPGYYVAESAPHETMITAEPTPLSVAATSGCNVSDEEGSNDPDFVHDYYYSTRLLGPITPFGSEFYELCVKKGYATTDDRDCEHNDQLWTRFCKVSADPSVPLYKICIRNSVTSADLKYSVPAETVAQVDQWSRNYGDVLLDTYKKKLAPRLCLLSMSEISEINTENLKKRSTSFVCAIYALSATCVDSWSLKKRAYLGLTFHRCAMTHIQRALYPVTVDALKTLVLLAAFPFQADTSLLNSWAMALAFDMRLNIDPADWQIPEEEKNLRRRLFWLILVSHRWSAFKHLYPNVNADCYDTIAPCVQEPSDKIFRFEIQVSELVATITQNFYSVRGSRMIHNNVESALIIARQIESQIISLQQSICEESNVDPETSHSVSRTMVNLNLQVAALMIHRPFVDNKTLSMLDALDHHRKAAQSASNCVDILQQMPDTYFTEAWPTHSVLMLAIITFTLMRESFLSKDETLRIRATDGLRNFMSIIKRQSSRWFLSRFGGYVISIAKAMSGENYEDLPGKGMSEVEPLMLESDMDPSDNVDLSDLEWDNFSQLLGLDSNSLMGGWANVLGS